LKDRLSRPEGPRRGPWSLRQPASGCRRIAGNEPCDVIIEDDHRRGILWNLSARGAYLMLIAPFPPLGQVLRLSFCLPDDPDPVRCEARVAWQNPPSTSRGLGVVARGLPPGCGLQFVFLPEEDKDRIRMHVRGSRH
jgi:hypothetical protein